MKLFEGLTFDDVLLVPQHSDVKSRSALDITTQLGTIQLDIPIVSANMDTITDDVMAIAMGNCGGLGILHRYASEIDIARWCQNIKSVLHRPVPSIGVQESDLEKAELYREYTDSICVDVAHGDSKAVVEMIKRLVDAKYINIIAGNVATGDGAMRLVDAGANVVKVGVGPGSVCTTRIVTGHGVPQLSAIDNVAMAVGDRAYIIADGGIRSSGDIVKALAAGADAVMIGGLFAGCQETPNINGQYRGMASAEAQTDFRGRVSNGTPEGVTIAAPAKGSVKAVIDNLTGGIRSGLSYSGCRNIRELHENAIFMKISSNGLIESHPHGIKK